jgi:electron transfer flavoprotein beta subunit
MNLLVFVKRVPDTESRIKVGPDGKSVAEDGLNFVISPYDEYAIEEALRLREAKGGKVTACVGASLGSSGSAWRWGADEAVWSNLPRHASRLRTRIS